MYLNYKYLFAFQQKQTARYLKRAAVTLFPGCNTTAGQTFVPLVLQTIFKPMLNK